MNKLRITSPGVLLILALLCAGSIFILDLLYLRPHVAKQRDGALHEQASKTAAVSRSSLFGEQQRLLSLCAVWTQNDRVSSLINKSKPDGQLAQFAEEQLRSERIVLAWISDPSGRIVTSWHESSVWSAQTDDALKSSLQKLCDQNNQISGMSPAGLAKIAQRVAIVAQHEIGNDGYQLWLGRLLDSTSLGDIGTAIGGHLVLIGTETIPRGAFPQKSSTHTLWPSGEDTMAVAWPAYDTFGNTLGCFRAEVPVVQINRQATMARRMILIVLSLSATLMLLVILATNILIAGPILRLLRRLQLFESGHGDTTNLTHDLHGEPLVLARRLESAFDRLAHMSKTDQLTGLANRRHFGEVLDWFYHQARRYNRPLSVIMIDIDYFKAVNDTGGHQAGDKLLKVVSGIIEEAARKADLPARYGGDEFTILLPETNANSAAAVAERILQAVRNHEHSVNSLQMKITVSIGLTDLNVGEIDSAEAMLATADQALYAAKEGGRNRVVQAGHLDGLASLQGEKVHKLCKKLAGLDSEFKSLFLQAIEEIMEILEQRDPFMGSHARKVQRYAVLIAKEMELPERVVKRIEIAAMLHDIGMLALPDTILLCPGELDDDKLKTMKKHPLYGVRIMEGMEFLEQEIPAVRYHHERYDGLGYPEGLVGPAIPLTARILSVADAFDALTSTRTFRKSMSLNEALRELRKEAGTQFDPAIVAVFVNLAAKLGEDMMAVPQGPRFAETTTEKLQDIPVQSKADMA